MRKTTALVKYELMLVFRSIMPYAGLLLLSLYSSFAGRSDPEYTGFDVFANKAAYAGYFFIFLVLSFIYIPYFFKDESEGINEIINSMPFRSIQLGFVRWFCAVGAGLLFCIIHLIIQLISLKSFYFGFSFKRLMEWYVVGCVPVVLLTASITFMAWLVFRKKITALMASLGVWIGMAIWDSAIVGVNNFPFLHLISPEAKYYETGFSQIAGFTKGRGIVLYSFAFIFILAVIIFFVALNTYNKRRERKCNGVIRVLCLGLTVCLFIPSILYTKTYEDIKNNFERKLDAAESYEQAAKEPAAGLKLKSIKLGVGINGSRLYAEGTVVFINRSDYALDKIMFILGENFTIESIKGREGELTYKRKGFVIEIPVTNKIEKGAAIDIKLAYSGKVYEWKKTNDTYRDYVVYSFINPECIYLSPNSGWYPQSLSNYPFSKEMKIVNAGSNKKIQTIDTVSNYAETFDVDIELKGLENKTVFSNNGVVEGDRIKIEKTDGVYLYAAKLVKSVSKNRNYYMVSGHNRYVDSLERELSSRENFFKELLPPNSIQDNIVETPFSNSMELIQSTKSINTSFINEKILYRLDSKNMYSEDTITLAYLNKWLPGKTESLNILKPGKIVSLEEALADYLMFLYNSATGKETYSTKVSYMSSGTMVTKVIEDQSPLDSRIDYHISYGINVGDSKYTQHFETIKSMITGLESVRKAGGTGALRETVGKLLNIVKKRPLEYKDVLNL